MNRLEKMVAADAGGALSGLPGPVPGEHAAPGSLLPDSRSEWAVWHGIAIGGLLVVSIAITWDAWADSLTLALKDEETNYVLAAPAVIAWILWARRKQLWECKPGGSLIGLTFVAAGWVLWSYGYRCHVFTFWHAGPVLVAAGCVLCVTGSQTFFAALPAFGAMFFLMPLTEYRRQWIAQPLQTATACVTQGLCDLLGIYVDRFGNMLSINGQDLTIAEACNGMRMVITLLFVCYALAFGMPLRWYERVLVLLVSPVVAIASNVVRLVPTVWVFGHFSQDVGEAFHVASGWMMIAFAFLLMRGMLVAIHLARRDIVQPARRGQQCPVPSPQR